MKKTILLLLGLTMGLTSMAQKDTLKVEIDGIEIIILTDDMDKLSEVDMNKIIAQMGQQTQELTKEFNERVKELTRQYEAGEITEEEYESNMELEAERFEIKMEALGEEMEAWGEAWGEAYSEEWEDNYSEQWEKWAEEWERRAEEMDGAIPPPPAPPHFPKQKDQVVPSDEFDDHMYHEYKKHRGKKRTTGQGDIHFGWNTMLDDGFIVSDEPGELRPWQSTFFTLGFAGKTRVGGENSIFYIRYGMQFNWHHFRLKGNNVLFKDADLDGIAFVPISDARPEIQNVSFSSYNAAYLDVPFLLILDFSDKGVDESISLGVGGYGGVRVGQKRNVIYDDFNNDPVKERIRNNFYMNQWRYGVMGQFGYGAFKITGKYDMNQFFRSEKNTPDYQIASISFGFAF